MTQPQAIPLDPVSLLASALIGVAASMALVALVPRRRKAVST